MITRTKAEELFINLIKALDGKVNTFNTPVKYSIDDTTRDGDILLVCNPNEIRLCVKPYMKWYNSAPIHLKTVGPDNPNNEDLKNANAVVCMAIMVVDRLDILDADYTRCTGKTVLETRYNSFKKHEDTIIETISSMFPKLMIHVWVCIHAFYSKGYDSDKYSKHYRRRTLKEHVLLTIESAIDCVCKDRAPNLEEEYDKLLDDVEEIYASKGDILMNINGTKLQILKHGKEICKVKEYNDALYRYQLFIMNATMTLKSGIRNKVLAIELGMK